jgi:hypothetical protein
MPATRELLKSLGFTNDPTVISDSPGGLSLDFGDFKLTASFGSNRWLQPSVWLGGVIATPRRLTSIECEMPIEVESWEQGAAWVTWCLDKHSAGRKFDPASPIPWLAEGRQNLHLLPWERKRAAYEARPHCWVERPWAKLALNALAEQLEKASNETFVTFSFDGAVLRIDCQEKVIAMPAEGGPWPQPFSIPSTAFKNLPKRLTGVTVEFSIWDSALTIGNRRYSGVVPLPSEANP